MSLDPSEPPPSSSDPAVIDRGHVSPTQSIVALLEVVLCSDYPTQIALGATFAAFGFRPYSGGHLQIGFVAMLSLVDSLVLVGLMALFLFAHGERPRDVFLGHRPALREMRFGVPLIFVALGMGLAILVTIQRYAPSLHTVETNPLKDLIRTPRDAWLFAIVVVVAGGVREELQRAFLLRRFEMWLGGATVGVVVTSISFGAGHLIQGADAAIATAALGAFWGIIYLRRRSVVAPMISHGGFNLVQTLQYLVTGR